MAHPLNHEAGAVPMPEDPRELAAALAGGKQSWDDTPYLAARFAERGERFTRSDSAWIATLPNRSEAGVFEKIEWLAQVLAARGMPSIILEEHLGVIAGALEAAVPEKRASYGVLRRAGERLKTQREAVGFGDEVLQAAASEFAGAVEDERGVRAQAGRLIASALADEAVGRQNARASTVAWFAEPARPDGWALATEALVRRLGA